MFAAPAWLSLSHTGRVELLRVCRPPSRGLAIEQGGRYSDKAGDLILPWGVLGLMGSLSMYYCQFNTSLIFEYRGDKEKLDWVDFLEEMNVDLSFWRDATYW